MSLTTKGLHNPKTNIPEKQRVKKSSKTSERGMKKRERLFSRAHVDIAHSSRNALDSSSYPPLHMSKRELREETKKC